MHKTRQTLSKEISTLAFTQKSDFKWYFYKVMLVNYIVTINLERTKF